MNRAVSVICRYSNWPILRRSLGRHTKGSIMHAICHGNYPVCMHKG